MPRITLTDFELERNAMKSVFHRDHAVIDKAFAERSATINIEAVGQCIEKYIASEFDFVSPGACGIGRITESTPRLGAHYRKSFAQLSEVELNVLAGMARRIVIAGYLNHALLSDSAPMKRHADPDSLFWNWLPDVYAVNPSSLSEGNTRILEMSTSDAANTFCAKLEALNCKKSFFSMDHLGRILFYYAFAGSCLRMKEYQ